MSEIIPFPIAPQIGMPPINIGGVSVLICEIRKGIMENENYTEEVGKDLGLINLK